VALKLPLLWPKAVVVIDISASMSVAMFFTVDPPEIGPQAREQPRGVGLPFVYETSFVGYAPEARKPGMRFIYYA
jgi:hypothetical protein